MSRELENAKAKLNKLNAMDGVLLEAYRVEDARLYEFNRKDPKDPNDRISALNIVRLMDRLVRECLDIEREMIPLKYRIKTLEMIENL